MFIFPFTEQFGCGVEIRASSFAHELLQRDRLYPSTVQPNTSAVGGQALSKDVVLSMCQVGKFMQMLP